MQTPALMGEHADDGDFVAGIELRAAEAVLPGLEGQFAALHLMKAHFSEETRYIGEGGEGAAVGMDLVWRVEEVAVWKAEFGARCRGGIGLSLPTSWASVEVWPWG